MIWISSLTTNLRDALDRQVVGQRAAIGPRSRH